MEKVYKVPVERQQKLEFGFRTLKAGVDTEYERNEKTLDESLMLTGDLNLAEVEWVIQYRVEDAYKYLFKVRDIEKTLRDISEAIMRQIAGDRTINEVLMTGRIEIKSEMKKTIQEVCRDYSMGIKIEQILLQDVNPPEPVRDAFNKVNEAQQEMKTLINQAELEYNTVIPEAEGLAKATLEKANGYKIKRINTAKGDSARFTDLYKEYIKAPEVTKRRLYLETMSKILPRLGNVIITDQKGNNVLPLLNMKLNEKVINSEN
jgi:membrane protease subunit HflK